MVTDRLSERAAEMGETIRDTGARVGEAVQEQFGKVRDRTSDYLAQGRERAQQMTRSMEGEIRAHPMRWLLVSTTVGIVIGLLGFLMINERD